MMAAAAQMLVLMIVALHLISVLHSDLALPASRHHIGVSSGVSKPGHGHTVPGVVASSLPGPRPHLQL